jgi:hypothetical protein
MTRVIALLSWYDEEPELLAACIASLAGCVDHLVAVDGPYLLYPGATTAPQSDDRQARVVLETARGARIGSTIVQPRRPWEGGEVEKRSTMFRYGLLEAGPDDWFLVIDADEAVTRCPSDLRGQLAAAADEGYEVAGVTFSMREDAAMAVPGARTGDWPGHRVLLRALPDLRTEAAHFYVIAGPDDAPRFLRGRYDLHDLEPCADLGDMVIRHRPHMRPPYRLTAKDRYYADRDRLMIERPILGTRIERLDGGHTVFNAQGDRERVIPADVVAPDEDAA